MEVELEKDEPEHITQMFRRDEIASISREPGESSGIETIHNLRCPGRVSPNIFLRELMILCVRMVTVRSGPTSIEHGTTMNFEYTRIRHSPS